jgi:hypothetical protein
MRPRPSPAAASWLSGQRYRPVSFAWSHHGIDGLHHRHIGVNQTIVPQLIGIRCQLLCVEHRVAALAVIIAAQPVRDVLRISDFIPGELIAADLCNVERNLGVS